jgi:hypothetical protein
MNSAAAENVYPLSRPGPAPISVSRPANTSVHRAEGLSPPLEKFINIILSSHHTDLAEIRAGRERYNITPARQEIIRRLVLDGWGSARIAGFLNLDLEDAEARIVAIAGQAWL